MNNTAMQLFCTYLDSNYVDRGICLWESLKRHYPDPHLIICCLDAKSHAVLSSMKKDKLELISLAMIEAQYPELLVAKSDRSRIEYYFTITPSLLRFVFEKFEYADYVTYLDSDLFFFSSPQPLFDEMARKDGHIGIIEHRFPERLQHLRIYGVYNVGWVTFKRSNEAWSCLTDWQRKCIDWCHDHVDGDRFADQKYLDRWPSEHKGVVVLNDTGANVALWNLNPKDVNFSKGSVQILNAKLIFYHFHGLSQINQHIFFTSARMYGVSLSFTVRHRIYAPYIVALRKTQKILKRSEVQPLIRYKHSAEDIAFARRKPMHGLFLFSALGITLP